MRTLFKILKRLAAFMALATLTLVIILAFKHESLPQGKEGPEADALAHKMLKAVNHAAYQKTEYLSWQFKGIHSYEWSKDRGFVRVRWDDHFITLNLNDLDKSEVEHKGMPVDSLKRQKLTKTAWDHFNNDSFWLVAPHKVFDEGTRRSIVTNEDGTRSLLVTYSSGGTTPGDSYLWHLDENGMPTRYQMWAKIIPVGGLEATWEGWKTFDNGLTLPTNHKLLFLNLDMGEVIAR